MTHTRRHCDRSVDPRDNPWRKRARSLRGEALLQVFAVLYAQHRRAHALPEEPVAVCHRTRCCAQLGIIHRNDAAFDAWRADMRLPRAGIMTVEGELVIVADIRAALRSGYVDVVGIRREVPS